MLLRTLKKKMDEDMPYESVMLPIKDEALLSLCQEMAQKEGLLFGQESNLSHTFLIEKHRLRDRTEVLLERKSRLNVKKQRTVASAFTCVIFNLIRCDTYERSLALIHLE